MAKPTTVGLQLCRYNPMTQPTSYPSYQLATGDNKARLELLPQHGGIINALVFTDAQGGQHNVIAGFNSLAAIEQDQYYRGVPLYPFVNRLDQGRYSFAGRAYQFPINEAARNNALHGFIQHLAVEITTLEVSAQTAKACVVYEYSGDRQAYPFAARIEMTYALNSAGSLELTMSVLNRHDQAVPVGIGWHPYFTLGEPMDQLLLQLPAGQQVLVDERLLPTGELLTANPFAQLSTIKTTQFDTCFALAAKPSIAETRLWSEKNQHGLAIWQEVGAQKYNFLQVCIPPDRTSVAIEPVTCGINGLNTQEGIVVLQSEEAFSATCGVRWLEAK